jgi:D-serine deaminase-like pyridoxal phosphate-dependent protein
MRFEEIETPVLLLDEAKMNRNIARMRARVDSLGVAFRPHLKTSKCIQVARRLVGDSPSAVCVSTLKEAEFFLAHGFTDILYAVGITPGKLQHVADLRARGCDLKIILDSSEAADAVSDFARQRSVALPALVEIDSDGQRAGVAPDDDKLLAIGKRLGSLLCGLMTHAGASYDCRGVQEIRDMAEQERGKTVRAAERLREAGMPCSIVSVGSTPTALFAEHLSGVTEVRAGVFVFQDLVMAGLAVCQIEDIAISVLCTVIGHQRERGWLITDAGWMSMSRDRGTARQSTAQGFGLVCDEAGQIIPGLVLINTSQEHGIIVDRSGNSAKALRFPIGTRLRILPNHACATAAQHAAYHVIGGRGSDDSIDDVWPRFSGW